MPYHGFPVIRISLGPQSENSSVGPPSWPKKQAFSLESRLRIKSTTASFLIISNTGYNSANINCQTSHHDCPTELPCVASSSDVGGLPADSETKQQLNISEHEDHPLEMKKIYQSGYQLDHNWKYPSSVLSHGENPKTSTVVLDNDLTKTTQYCKLCGPTYLRSEGNSSASDAQNTTRATKPLSCGHQPSFCWLRKTRRKKNWLVSSKINKTLDTIPEHQEWQNQEKCRNKILTSVKNESLELKSVFENDSDSEDEIE